MVQIPCILFNYCAFFMQAIIASSMVHLGSVGMVQLVGKSKSSYYDCNDEMNSNIVFLLFLALYHLFGICVSFFLVPKIYNFFLIFSISCQYFFRCTRLFNKSLKKRPSFKKAIYWTTHFLFAKLC